jgi:uncharacterized protein YkwD
MPPQATRLSRTRVRHHLRPRDILRVHPARLLLGVLVTVGITAVILAVPVVSGKVSGPAPVALDSSASAARASAGSPVVMGEDGVPVPAAVASGGTGSRSAGPESTTTAGTAASSAEPDRAVGALSSSAQSAGTSTARAKSGPGTVHSPTRSGTSPSSNGLTGSRGTASTDTASTGTADSGVPTAAAPAATTVPANAADRVLALLNDERAGASCGPLRIDSALTATARAHSAALRDGSEPDHTVAAVAHSTSDPASVVEGWLADPTDKAALLDCTPTAAGLGIATGGNGGPWWTLLLG